MRHANRNKKEKDDLFIRLTAVQLIAAVLIFFLLFLLVKKNDGLANRIRDEFSSLMSQDWDVAGWFREDARAAAAAEHKDDALFVPAFGDAPGNEADSEQHPVILTSASVGAQERSAGVLTQSFYGNDAPVAPVNGVVTSLYGERIHPITGEESFHSGRDIAADEGADIFAVYDGVVTAVGVGESSGNYIKIHHGGGLVALYCHCSEVYAEKGDVVRKGDIVAAVGETGAATGPHLHFEIRVNGELTDPAVLLDKAVYVR